MYLVEIESGREALYDSVTALETAIRSGEVGSQARIFHRASSRWISITLHPVYKRTAGALDSEPLPPLARTRWTFFGTEPKGREIDEPAGTKAEAEQTPATSSGSPGRLRSLLSRAFRSRSPTPVPETSEASGS